MPCSTLPTPTHSPVVSAFVEVDVMNTNGAITVMPGAGTATGVAAAIEVNVADPHRPVDGRRFLPTAGFTPTRR
jgi:hypothetical protein